VFGGTKKLVIGAAAVLWLAAIGGGGAALLRYSGTAGAAGDTPPSWPAATRLQRGDSATLLVFAHPFCACTRATLAELDRLLTRTQAQATVVFMTPHGGEGDWRVSSLVERARSMHGVTVTFDEDGADAARFGARTSGHAVLYDSAGSLRYSGGITPARGHEGWSAGQQVLAAALAQARGTRFADSTGALGVHDDTATAPTYGCGLNDAAPAGIAEREGP
jgi:hypothetical protein